MDPPGRYRASPAGVRTAGGFRTAGGPDGGGPDDGVPDGPPGAGQLERRATRTATVSPTSLPIARRTAAVTGSLWVPSPSAMNELSNG